jgi:hypothetical protein
MTYDQIKRLLEGMSERFEWEKVMEGDNIIGLTFVSSFNFHVMATFINQCWVSRVLIMLLTVGWS